MGTTLIETATGRVLHWQRWGEPDYDPATQQLVPSDEPPAEGHVWDGTQFVPGLNYLKAQKRQQLDAWLAAEEAQGYTPDGQAFAMRLGAHDQTQFNLLDTGVQKLKAAGHATDESPVPIGAADGRTYTVTVAQWEAISVGYSIACMALWQQYAAQRDAIEAAQTPGDLDLIQTNDQWRQALAV